MKFFVLALALIGAASATYISPLADWGWNHGYSDLGAWGHGISAYTAPVAYAAPAITAYSAPILPAYDGGIWDHGYGGYGWAHGYAAPVWGGYDLWKKKKAAAH